MANLPSAPPVLSTPDAHILNNISDASLSTHQESLSDDQVETRYEIARTISEIRENRWHRIALQFPDDMLPHSARVYQMLARGLRSHGATPPSSGALQKLGPQSEISGSLRQGVSDLSLEDSSTPVKLTILADTSYGACCVDEIAAEHVDADAIVHYGRACLSPTARLPVLHIYTRRELDHDKAVHSFQAAFPDQRTKVVVTADAPYAAHVQSLCTKVAKIGYDSIFEASIVHDPSSLIPNRTIPPSITENPASLQDWHLFHISEPPTSLLLTLTSRMASIVVHSTSREASESVATASTSILLRRRYALVTRLTTVSIWGILINTLSVRNYLSVMSHVQHLISEAGKKSYLFVVGKINAAKVANFSEIGGWVVIGCWESSLIDSKEFYKPIITPFELELALSPDDTRVWTGEWRADFASLLETSNSRLQNETSENGDSQDARSHGRESEEESEPPEFDLRTGRYVSKSRPMGRARTNGTDRINDGSQSASSTALTRRANGDLISVNGVASPAAEFLAKERTWRGLGSDFEVRYEDEDEQGGLIEEGMTGVAGGYTVGESDKT
jgi:diphthamide biosynthesis protein 2